MIKPANVQEVAALIDHTILKASATWEEVFKVAEEGASAAVASICVNPIWVSDVAGLLNNSPTLCCSVVGFPLGASSPFMIAHEAEMAVRDGAREIDMVISVGHALMHDWKQIEESVRTVKAAIGENCLKVILEVCELNAEEIRTAGLAALSGNADYLKTSTGFGKYGATVESVRILSEIAGNKAGVKAAGGIRTFDDLLRMVDAGATRIGASSTMLILQQAQTTFLLPSVAC